VIDNRKSRKIEAEVDTSVEEQRSGRMRGDVEEGRKKSTIAKFAKTKEAEVDDKHYRPYRYLP